MASLSNNFFMVPTGMLSAAIESIGMILHTSIIKLNNNNKLATMPSLCLLLLLDGLGQVFAMELYPTPASRSLTLRL